MSKLVFIDENGKRHYSGCLAIEKDEVYLPCERVASLDEIKTVQFQHTLFKRGYILKPATFWERSQAKQFLNAHYLLDISSKNTR